eukprot:m.94348 g.94348  ORF g.94348 m.94348 type:complete len:630 (+) comp13441_c0_seq2:168-2057(+)
MADHSPERGRLSSVNLNSNGSGEGEAVRMSTSQCVWNPNNIKHEWTLDKKTGLPHIKGLPQDELVAGFRLFFINKHDEALQFFQKYEDVPLCAMGKAAVMYIWSVMTLEDDDLGNTIQYLKQVEKLVDQYIAKCPVERGWFFSEGAPTPLLVHYRVMSAECTLLTAVLQLLRDSIFQKTKGILNIRSAYGKYHKIENQQKQLLSKGTTLDDESRSAIHFGLGAFNLVSSLLPPRLLALVSFLGFPCDRQFGLDQLQLSLDMDSVRSPISALTLLVHHVFIQGAFCHTELLYEKDAKHVIDQSLELFPNGGLFLLFHGRNLRLQKKNIEAAEAFQLASDVQAGWLPLVHYCSYEMAFTTMFLHDFKTSVGHWDKLLKENEWSKGFYAYGKSVCQLLSGDKDGAVRTYDSISGLLDRSKKINGRPIPVDRFVRRKTTQYHPTQKKDHLLVLPAIELIYVWNGFPQMGPELLEKSLDMVKSWREECDWDNLDADERSLYHLFIGAIFSQLDRDEEAEKELAVVEKMRKSIKREKWAVAYARYEMGMMYLKQDKEGTPRTVSMLKKAIHWKGDYNWDLQLHIRCHLAMYALGHDTGKTEGAEMPVELTEKEAEELAKANDEAAFHDAEEDDDN